MYYEAGTRCFDRVVLNKMVEEETTASGIVLPGQGDKEKPGQGEIIAVGPGGLVDGKEVKMQVKAGDKVLYSRYAGSDVERGRREVCRHQAERYPCGNGIRERTGGEWNYGKGS